MVLGTLRFDDRSSISEKMYEVKMSLEGMLVGALSSTAGTDVSFNPLVFIESVGLIGDFAIQNVSLISLKMFV